MKITVLTRYPRIEKSLWKRDIIEQLLQKDCEIFLLFGESSLWRQFKAGLKLYGNNLVSRSKEAGEISQPLLINKFFKNKISIAKVNDLNSKKAESMLKKFGPDIVILLGTGIIRKNILQIPKVGTIHCHQGYLPDFRGINTIEWSIFYGVDVYITTHFVDPGVDTGPILLRKKIEIDGQDNISSIRKKCQEESVNLILNTVKGIRNNNINPEEQKKEQGKQYFAMHPLFINATERKIQKSG